MMVTTPLIMMLITKALVLRENVLMRSVLLAEGGAPRRVARPLRLVPDMTIDVRIRRCGSVTCLFVRKDRSPFAVNARNERKTSEFSSSFFCKGRSEASQLRGSAERSGMT